MIVLSSHSHSHSQISRKMFKYAKNGDVDNLRIALDEGADVNSKIEAGFQKIENRLRRTALIIAADQGHSECIRLLLDRNADIESKDNSGSTALLVATEKGHLESVRLLLDRNADIESKDINGRTAFLVAAKKSRLECIRLLLDKNADVESNDDSGWTALGIAAMSGHLECVRLLLDRNADIHEGLLFLFRESVNKQMLLDEILDRRRRASFDAFINRHIECEPLKSRIYSICYPDGDLRVARPLVGWIRAQAVRDKYYSMYTCM